MLVVRGSASLPTLTMRTFLKFTKIEQVLSIAG